MNINIHTLTLPPHQLYMPLYMVYIYIYSIYLYTVCMSVKNIDYTRWRSTSYFIMVGIHYIMLPIMFKNWLKKKPSKIDLYADCSEETQYNIIFLTISITISVTLFSSAINVRRTLVRYLFKSHAMSKHYILIYYTSKPIIRIIMLVKNNI